MRAHRAPSFFSVFEDLIQRHFMLSQGLNGISTGFGCLSSRYSNARGQDDAGPSVRNDAPSRKITR